MNVYPLLNPKSNSVNNDMHICKNNTFINSTNVCGYNTKLQSVHEEALQSGGCMATRLEKSVDQIN